MSTNRVIRTASTFVTDPGVIHCRCKNIATHLMETHRTDDCTPEEPTIADFLCNTCVEGVYSWAAKLLHPTNGETKCRTCDLTFDRLSAIIVNLIPIPKAGT